MADSKRQKIVNEMETRFKTIKIAAGYQTDIGNAVYIWYTGTILPSELTTTSSYAALIIRDLDEAKKYHDGDKYRGKFVRELHMQLEVAAAGETAAVGIRKIVADIEKAISVDTRWNKLALGTRPRIDRAIVEQESVKIGGLLYEYFVDYHTEAFNAYQ